MASLDKESFDRIVTAFENAGYEARSYSGRAMYGRECLGVECDNGAGLVVELALALIEADEDKSDIEEVLEHLRDPRGDSMGRGSILYWPSIPWLADEAGDDTEGEEFHDIELCTEAYEEEHGRKPRGEGNWAFFFQGLPDTGLTGPGFSAPLFLEGEFRKVSRLARGKAAEAGCDAVSVGS